MDDGMARMKALATEEQVALARMLCGCHECLGRPKSSVAELAAPGYVRPPSSCLAAVILTELFRAARAGEMET